MTKPIFGSEVWVRPRAEKLSRSYDWSKRDKCFVYRTHLHGQWIAVQTNCITQQARRRINSQWNLKPNHQKKKPPMTRNLLQQKSHKLLRLLSSSLNRKVFCGQGERKQGSENSLGKQHLIMNIIPPPPPARKTQKGIVVKHRNLLSLLLFLILEQCHTKNFKFQVSSTTKPKNLLRRQFFSSFFDDDSNSQLIGHLRLNAQYFSHSRFFILQILLILH